MKTTGKILKWGNSAGVRINRKLLEKAGFKENDQVELTLSKKYSTAGDLFGRLKKKVDTDKALLEIDRMFGEK